MALFKRGNKSESSGLLGDLPQHISMVVVYAGQVAHKSMNNTQKPAPHITPNISMTNPLQAIPESPEVRAVTEAAAQKAIDDQHIREIRELATAATKAMSTPEATLASSVPEAVYHETIDPTEKTLDVSSAQELVARAYQELDNAGPDISLN